MSGPGGGALPTVPGTARSRGWRWSLAQGAGRCAPETGLVGHGSLRQEAAREGPCGGDSRDEGAEAGM